MLFELNCSYYLRVFFEKDINFCFFLKKANKLVAELQELLAAYYKNFYQTQQLQKKPYKKGIKPKSYTPVDKVLLKSKYIQIKCK